MEVEITDHKFPTKEVHVKSKNGIYIYSLKLDNKNGIIIALSERPLKSIQISFW